MPFANIPDEWCKAVKRHSMVFTGEETRNLYCGGLGTDEDDGYHPSWTCSKCDRFFKNAKENVKNCVVLDEDYKKWVDQVIDTDESEPFCPFDGPEKVGYCNIAYSGGCYTCEEARGAWEKKQKEKRNEPKN